MRKLLLLLFIPFISFAQLTDKELGKMEQLLSQASGLSEFDYNLATSVSDSLLVKHPNNSLVLINRVSLYHLYVKKSKCQKYTFPNLPNICEDALSFYDTVSNKITYKRISFAYGMIYYNWSLYSKKPTKNKAIAYFTKAIKEGSFSDFEKKKIQTYISWLE